MEIRELKTPCALVDLDVLVRNAEAMAARTRRLGVRLRPHVKTHKCAEAARIQVRGQFGGIAVSTLAEAEHFADAGFVDITYAVPIGPDRLERVARLNERIDRLSVLVDHEDTLGAIERSGLAAERPLPAYLKVDCGYHRAGVDPASEESVRLARRLSESPAMDFRGILTHAGHAYACRTRSEVVPVSAQERDVLVEFRNRLQASGIPVDEVSVGSTPTLCAADDLDGVTEARPGNYVFFDAFQSAIGSCRQEDIAFGVLSTVVGSYPHRRAAVIDAGALALSRDPGPVHVDRDCGFGIPTDLRTGERLAGVRIVSVSQEHGLLDLDVPGGARLLRVGDRIRVLPNHSCLSAALFDRYHVVRGDEVVETWRPVRGW